MTALQDVFETMIKNHDHSGTVEDALLELGVEGESADEWVMCMLRVAYAARVTADLEGSLLVMFCFGVEYGRFAS